MEHIELWKDTKYYIGYEVSSFGRVRVKGGDFVSQVITGKPEYFYVNLHRNVLNKDWKTRKLVRVHVLVAEAFINNPFNKELVDHIDRNRFNNNLFNLRFSTHAENMRNLHNNIKLSNGLMLMDHVNKYNDPKSAYSWILKFYKNNKDIDHSVLAYEEWLTLRKRCDELGVSHISVANKIKNGTPLWNALYSVAIHNPRSLELIYRNGVGMWFPSKQAACNHLNIKVDKLNTRLRSSNKIEDILSKNQFASTYVVDGITATFKEHCIRYGLSEGCVRSRMCRRGLSLEDAVAHSKSRVRMVRLNGENISVKQLYLSFGICPIKANNIRSRKNITIEQTLQHFGVDTSSIKLEY